MRTTPNISLQVPEHIDTLTVSLTYIQNSFDTIDTEIGNLKLQFKNIGSMLNVIDGGNATTVPNSVIDGGGAV